MSKNGVDQIIMATVNLKSFPLPENAVCPVCSADIQLYDPAGSEFCICKSCNTYLQFKDDEPQIIKKVQATALKPLIPIGAEGVLADYTFRVTAYLEKNEQDPKYHWREYILYNYEKGYAALSEFDGHWNLVWGDNFLPELKNVKNLSKSVEFKDIVYNQFHKYPSKITALAGEFDWDVLAEDIYTHEFIAPPFIIIKESDTRNKFLGTHYYHGEYQEPETIAAAFGIDKLLMPSRVGIGSNQPSKMFNFWNWIYQLSLYAFLALMFITLLLALIKPSRNIFESTFKIVYEPVKGQYEFKPFMTPSFEIKDRASFLELGITSQVSNNWLEATIVLVNEATNETWEVTKGVEYYAGVEDGEAWTEGDRTANVLLSEVPKGKYHLNVYTASGDPLRDEISVNVTENGILWRNLWVCALALAVIPIITYFMSRRFERRRWENSDFSPFEY